jgi:hypothetical protein
MSMAVVQALTALAGDPDTWLHTLPVQHVGMSFAMQSASVETVPQRLIACEQSSVTMVEHWSPTVWALAAPSLAPPSEPEVVSVQAAVAKYAPAARAMQSLRAPRFTRRSAPRA